MVATLSFDGGGGGDFDADGKTLNRSHALRLTSIIQSRYSAETTASVDKESDREPIYFGEFDRD
jgi:hypothetical protein